VLLLHRSLVHVYQFNFAIFVLHGVMSITLWHHLVCVSHFACATIHRLSHLFILTTYWLGFDNNIVPAAGVKPTRYGRQIFIGCLIVLQLTSLSAMIINGIGQETSPSMVEVINAIAWFTTGAAITVLVGNFIVLGRHLLVLLKSHLASMIMTEGMLNGRHSTHNVGANGSITPTPAAVRQRTVELQRSIDRIQIIVRLLIVTGAVAGKY
jgi:hypothetical protein